MRRELLMTMKIQSGEIILQNLRFHAFHGVMPQERFVGNDYVLNLRISYPQLCRRVCLCSRGDESTLGFGRTCGTAHCPTLEACFSSYYIHFFAITQV